MVFSRGSKKTAEAEKIQQILKSEHDRIRVHLREATETQEILVAENLTIKVDLEQAMAFQESLCTVIQQMHEENFKVRAERMRRESILCNCNAPALEDVNAEVGADLIHAKVEQARVDLLEAQTRQQTANQELEIMTKDLENMKEKKQSMDQRGAQEHLEFLKLRTEHERLQAQSAKGKEELEILVRQIIVAQNATKVVESLIILDSVAAEHDKLYQEKVALQRSTEKAELNTFEIQHELEEFSKTATKNLAALRVEMEELEQDIEGIKKLTSALENDSKAGHSSSPSPVQDVTTSGGCRLTKEEAQTEASNVFPGICTAVQTAESLQRGIISKEHQASRRMNSGYQGRRQGIGQAIVRGNQVAVQQVIPTSPTNMNLHEGSSAKTFSFFDSKNEKLVFS